MSRASLLRRAARLQRDFDTRKNVAKRRRRRVHYSPRDCPYCGGPRKLYVHDATHVITMAQCYDCGAEQFWSASGKYIAEFRPGDHLSAKNEARRKAQDPE